MIVALILQVDFSIVDQSGQRSLSPHLMHFPKSFAGAFIQLG